MSMPRVDIVLSTYNGQQYLQELLESIAGQSYPNWRLLVRDDGSRDQTIGILQRHRDTFQGKITIIDEPGGNLGVVQSYSALLGRSDAEYIMFSDQDDVWLPEKIAVTFEEMRRVEQRAAPGTPVLVHTDATVVNAGLAPISPSLWNYQKCDPESGAALKRLLLQNVATGCTVMINRALRDRGVPIPAGVMMHDWWLTLVASAFGRIGHVPKPTLLYRQHGRNESGAHLWNPRVAFQYLFDIVNTLRGIRRANAEIQNQAQSFSERYGDLLNRHDRHMVQVYSRLRERNYFVRRYFMVKYGFFYTDTLRNIGRLLFS